MKNLQLDHINLAVPNLEKAVEYYTEVLGYEIKEQYNHEGKIFMFVTDGSIVYEILEDTSITDTFVDHIAYKSTDIKADFEHFNKLGLITETLTYIDFVFENGVDYFFIKGTANERIEFCQRR